MEDIETRHDSKAGFLYILINNNNNVFLDNIKNIYAILPIVHELYLQTKPIVKYKKKLVSMLF